MSERPNYGRPMNEKGMEELKAAVVEQAMRDYASIKLKRGFYHPSHDMTPTRRAKHLQELKDWLFSPVFKFWSNLDPRLLLKGMDKNLQEGRIFYTFKDGTDVEKEEE